MGYQWHAESRARIEDGILRATPSNRCDFWKGQSGCFLPRVVLVRATMNDDWELLVGGLLSENLQTGWTSEEIVRFDLIEKNRCDVIRFFALRNTVNL